MLFRSAAALSSDLYTLSDIVLASHGLTRADVPNYVARKFGIAEEKAAAAAIKAAEKQAKEEERLRKETAAADRARSPFSTESVAAFTGAVGIGIELIEKLATVATTRIFAKF